MWNWPFWKYPYAAFGVLCWAVLTWSNVMTVEAMSGSDLWGTRILMALMGALDVVGLFIMPGVAWMLRRRSALGALGCVLIGAVCLLAEGAGAHRYLTQMTASAEAPSKDVEKARADAQADIEREQRSLESARAARLKAAAKGRDTDELAKSERASLAAIEQLRRAMPKSSGVQAFARFAGYELYAAVVLVVLSQVAFAVVQARGVEERPRRTNIMTDPAVADLLKALSKQSRMTVHPEPMNTVLPLLDAEPDMYSHAIENTHNEHAQEHSVQPVHAQLALVPKDPFAEQALAYSKNGFSVRAIAKNMGCSPTKIQNVLTALKKPDSTTPESTRQ